MLSSRSIAVVVVLSVATFILLPGTASAAPPVLDSVEYGSRALTVTWTLPPGVEAFSLEASQSPRLKANGGFAELDVYEALEESETRITVPQRYEREFELWVFEPGTYYVHVGGSDSNCDSCPDVEYSETMTIVVPREPSEFANTICKAYLPAAKTARSRAQQANTARKFAAALDLVDTIVSEVRFDIAELLTPPPEPSPAKRFKAMLASARAGAARYSSAADAIRDGKFASAQRSVSRGSSAFRSASKRADTLALPNCKRLFGYMI